MKTPNQSQPGTENGRDTGQDVKNERITTKGSDGVEKERESSPTNQIRFKQCICNSRDVLSLLIIAAPVGSF